MKVSLARVFLVALIGAASSGCTTMYVSNALHDVPQADYRHPAHAQPVQLVFAFQTKGAPNSQATNLLRQQVTDVVRDSGLFASVSDTAVPGGALLSVVIDNVQITSNGGAFSKGMVTGMTLGLVGSSVADGYNCTLDYQATSGTEHLVHTNQHAILTNVGAKGAPANATKAANAEAAVRTVVRQSVGNALKDLSLDGKFGQ